MTGLSLNPSAMDYEGLTPLETLVVREKSPPKLSSVELHQLDFNIAGGISAVYEALALKPIQYVGHQELSRFVSLDALSRMGSCATITQLQNNRTEFQQIVKTRKQIVRERCWGLLHGVSRGYSPFKACRLHIWAWDDRVNRAVRTTLSDAGLEFPAFTIFCAESLVDLRGLGEVAGDLRSEIDNGMICLRALLSMYQYLNGELG